jgi:hypothetical protein
VVLLDRNISELNIYYQNVFNTTLSNLVGLEDATLLEHFSLAAVDNSTLSISVTSTGFYMEVGFSGKN